MQAPEGGRTPREVSSDLSLCVLYSRSASAGRRVGGTRRARDLCARPLRWAGKRAADSVVPLRAFTASAANLRQGGFVEHAAASANADATRTAPFPSFGQGLAKPFATCSRAHCHLWQRAVRRRNFGSRSKTPQTQRFGPSGFDADSGLPAPAEKTRDAPLRRRRTEPET
jgi:hypothetical protein